MAIDSGAEPTTTDKNGFAFRRASQIIKSEIDYVLTHTDRINDFTVGSVARTMIEAESIEIEKLYYYTLENLQEAIDDSVTSAFGFDRKQATYAYGNVLVRLNSQLGQDLVINRGTAFTSSQEAYQQEYRTTVPYRIPKGSRSFVIEVQCTVIGSYGNIPANVIDRTSDIGAIASVTNPEAFNTGSDEETPEQEKVRFRRMIQSLARGTNQSLLYQAESVPNVAGAALFESTYGAVVIYAHDANGNLSADLQRQVADALVDYKPAGIKVFVLPVHKSVVALDVSVQVSDSNLETDGFLQLIRNNISDYINTLTVGDPLYKANIIQKIMDTSDTGIVDTNVDVKVYPDKEMLGEQGIDDDTIINVKGVLVNQPYLRPVDITSDPHYGMVGVTDTKVKQAGGNTYKDAIVPNQNSQDSTNGTDNSDNTLINTGITNSEGDIYTKPIEVGDVYKTNSNELLRLAICNVKFNYLDFQEPIDKNGTNTDTTGKNNNIE